ncbi:MAG: nitroreductase family protein [Erysipelotrichaceae bacterium]|nr:nitroreductase family protein [Erysipelotrichaceae bacterium]
MDEMLEAIKQRRSIRKYLDKEVSLDLIDKICTAGAYAASGGGRQPVIVLAVTERDKVKQLSKLNASVMNVDIDPFYGAPVVLVVLADKNTRTYVYDGSLALGNMMLEASSLGLGSCWIHRAKEMFESEEGKSILAQAGIVGDYEGIGNLIVGYPAEQPVAKERKEPFVYTLKG